jgi:hypothetical protein
MNAANKANLREAVLNPPLRGLFQKLADTEGYSGSQNDLDKLKSWSSQFKQRDPAANRDVIAILDNAIASHEGEIRTAISTVAAAKSAHVFQGANIQPLFVNRKLAFLDSVKADFYDRGPFDVPLRVLLANALEERYFLQRSSGSADEALLRKEITKIDELLDRYTDRAKYNYLTISQRNLQINSTLFWRGSVSFALADNEGAEKTFKELALGARTLPLNSEEPLASKNDRFALDSRNVGHVFVYRVFDFPYEIMFRGAQKGQWIIDVKDPLVLQRYYNPAQLALVACAQLGEAGSNKGLEAYFQAVKDLVFSDYYVVAASGQSTEEIGQVAEEIKRESERNQNGQEIEALVNTINLQGAEFLDLTTKGARRCGIEKNVQDEIYAPFQFKSQIRRLDGSQKKNYVLLYGGRMTANQATIVSDFLSNKLLSHTSLREGQIAPGSAPYIARMPLDE